ncbi:MAG: hypothetical protein BGN96_17245 [Bacteroidales bacterium 45-6]|nr:MAG: hypothetical protein BGN96_17245 [Bacteroidales bacterium 45-6]
MQVVQEGLLRQHIAYTSSSKKPVKEVVVKIIRVFKIPARPFVKKYPVGQLEEFPHLIGGSNFFGIRPIAHKNASGNYIGLFPA